MPCEYNAQEIQRRVLPGSNTQVQKFWALGVTSHGAPSGTQQRLDPMAYGVIYNIDAAQDIGVVRSTMTILDPSLSSGTRQSEKKKVVGIPRDARHTRCCAIPPGGLTYFTHAIHVAWALLHRKQRHSLGLQVVHNSVWKTKLHLRGVHTAEALNTLTPLN